MFSGIEDIEKEDEEIIEKVLKGERECFGMLIEKYQKKIYAYIKRKYYIDNDDMDDIMQDTFIKCYKNLNSFKKGHDFYPWLAKIAINMSRDFLRNKITRKNRIQESFEDPLSVKEQKDPVKEIIELDGIKESLSELSSEYREVLIMRAEGLSYSEISQKISVPVGTVMSRLNRGRKIILDKFSKRA